MVALGICNFAGSFLGSMPVGGSFSRCAVNSASGVKTTLGGLYTGIIVILRLAFLMPACALIPKATLGAVVFCGVVFTIEYQIIKPIWNSKSKINLNVQMLQTIFIFLRNGSSSWSFFLLCLSFLPPGGWDSCWCFHPDLHLALCFC